MVLAIFQQDPAVLDLLHNFITQQFPGLLIGAILGVAGKLFIDSKRAKRRRFRAARSLTSAAQPPLHRLTTALDRFDTARRANPEALSYYFDHQDAVFREKDDKELAGAKAGADVLSQECLDSWGRALDEARTASRLHKSMRSLVGRPNAARLLQRAGGYRDQLQDTLSEFKTALERTTDHSAEDTQRVIGRLLREL